ncbi:uncharacterized protein LOC127752020 [Frankliniella occidentalis]|uniref:Uncharacterized protein LOC127752020 n=1 Tax=Frankliniella occidentalis TaxID=133901 RepID=A0A9C6XB95_FRAOC|nr:uncharacterized protein LOC127752020 [Frankliniella occidentalis]
MIGKKELIRIMSTLAAASNAFAFLSTPHTPHTDCEVLPLAFGITSTLSVKPAGTGRETLGETCLTTPLGRFLRVFSPLCHNALTAQRCLYFHSCVSASYLTACSIKDPKINECVVRKGRAAIPFIINGDPKYRVPNMNPMVIPELALWQGTSAVGLKLAWKNAEIHGLKDADFLDCE